MSLLRSSCDNVSPCRDGLESKIAFVQDVIKMHNVWKSRNKAGIGIGKPNGGE